MESLRHYLIVTLVSLLALAGTGRAQVPSIAARSLSLASPPTSTVPFASLTNPSIVPQTNGTITYCSNCTQTAVCAAGGSGAVASLANNTWQCGLGTSTSGLVSINPGTAGQVGGYHANGTTISPMTSIDTVNVNGVINAQTYGAKGDGVTDNSAAFKAAVVAAGIDGTLLIPAGTYMWTDPSTFAFTGTQMSNGGNLSVTVEGSSTGATILVPTFSGAGNAISFQDTVNEGPVVARGGVRNVMFSPPSPIPTNLNLIFISDVLGETLTHVAAQGFYGAGDSMIELTPGVGANAFTEKTTMTDIRSWFNTNMLTINMGGLNTSVNNTTMLSSHCDLPGPPATGAGVSGACLNLVGVANGTNPLLASYFQFNANLNNTSTNHESLIKTDHQAADLGGDVEFHISSQSPSGPNNYCFNAPASTGNWYFLGVVQCGQNMGSFGGNPVYTQVVPYIPGTGGPSLLWSGSYGLLAATAYVSSGTPTLTNGTFAPSTNPTSTTGEVTATTTGTVTLTTGFNCTGVGPNAHVVGVVVDQSTNPPTLPLIASRNAVTLSWAGVAGNVYDYSAMSCG